MRIREYRAPLGILAAGIVGVSLLCSVSAMAMTDLRNYVPATLIPLNIFDLAVSNLQTAVALTEQSVTQFVPTETITASPTVTASLTSSPTNTPTRFFTATKRPTRPPRDSTAAAPSNPNNPGRTSTPRPDTPVPPTDTPIPPTDIPPTAIPTTAEPPTPEPPTPEPPTPEPPTAESSPIPPLEAPLATNVAVVP